jgi:hypothetical protein
MRALALAVARPVSLPGRQPIRADASGNADAPGCGDLVAG